MHYWILTAINTMIWFLLVLLLVGAFYTRHSWRLIWKLNGWQGVLLQPIFWLIILFYYDPNNILGILGLLKKLYKRTIAVMFFHRMMIHIDDPESIESVLNSPDCRDKAYDRGLDFMGSALLTSRGEKWKIRRRQLNPTLSHQVLLTFFDAFNSVSDELVHKIAWDLEMKSVKKMNLEKLENLLSCGVLAISCRTMMGTDMKMVDKEAHDIAYHYKNLLELTVHRLFRPWLLNDFVFWLLDSVRYAKYQHHWTSVQQFVKKIIEQKLKESESNEYRKENAEDDRNIEKNEDSSRKRIFIEQMLHLAKMGEVTSKNVLEESISMILVSYETLKNSTSIAILCLAMHPECQQKLRAEIRDALPNAGSQQITFQHLQDLKYLDMVVNESLRLFSTVPMLLRTPVRDTELNLPQVRTAGDSRSTITVPRHALLSLDIFNMQRNPKYWGINAQQFQPESHFGDFRERAHPYAFVPFAKGQRSCIGSKYSIFLSKILLIKLIDAFEFSTITRPEQLEYIDMGSLKFKNSDHIQLELKKLKH